MRLRALHLGNVRKFAGQRASITGIGDGITVVSEANEFGKSTFFDAIHALFFEKFSSAAKSVKSLQPYAKGAVEIAAEIETDDGLFRVEKTFLKGSGSARILRLPGAGLLAQDDEAERWIARTLGSDKNGPAGLLWVRQGVLGLDPDSKVEAANQLETRRDLLSSVSGEIDAMTGGRRMDRVMKRVAEDLKALVTATGKPTGAWRALQTQIAGQEADLATLEAQIDKLSTALTSRKQAEAQLAHLDQAAAKSTRAQALAKAQDAFNKAEAYAGRVAMAEQAHKLAQVEAKADQDRLDAFLAAIRALEETQAAAVAAAEAAAKAQDLERQRQARLAAATATHGQANVALTEARATLDAARRHADARAAKARALDLNKRLQQIEEAQKTRDAHRAILEASTATKAWLRQVEEADQTLSTQAAAMAAQVASVQVTYSGTARVTHNDKPLAERQPLSISGPTELVLPGIGTMLVRGPVAEAAASDLDALRGQLNALLDAGGVTSIRDARDLAADRAKAVQECETADAVLAILAPEGVDALRTQKAAADLAAQGEPGGQGTQAVDEAPPKDLATLEALVAEAAETEAATRADMALAEGAFATAREAWVRAQAAAQTAREAHDQAHDKARATAGAEAARDATRTALIRAQAQAAEAVAACAATLADLRLKAPDMATAQAELTRTQEAVHAADRQMQTLRVRIAALSAEISALSETGVEQTRDTLAGQLDTDRAREARYREKAVALTRLKTALEAERSAARDTYFGPVQAELKPLLAILYDEAGLQFDTDSLLPAGLTRAETEERLDSLSGGTQEQIAILTRLAFARLFKGQGRHMPIVLDDALVYSDDGRIVKMFTALTRVAQDQQILVFTCRTMAFLELGGTRPEVTIHDL